MPFWSSASRRAFGRAAAMVLLCPLALSAQRQTNGLLVGRVLSGDVAVPGAVIFVSGGRVTLARVDGRYRMSLPVGRYQVRAQRIGYATASDSVTVNAAGPATLNFRLDRSSTPLEAVATLAARIEERASIDALVPIDVVDGTQLRATGRVETSRALQASQASVHVSHATVGQGTDLIHPFYMRGLSPDQVLVLVNGKRRHSSAQVNVTQSPGRGSSGVDLDAIPASMIERIEVLHGDAVAQYGADAIAGVVNVVLKSGVHGFASSTAGATNTTYNRDESAAAVPYLGGARSASDGRAFQASIDKGVVFGERGFLHGGMELRDRGATNRNLRDPRLVGVVDDVFGDPHTHDGALFLNGGNLFTNGMEAYGNVGGSRRRISAAGAAVPGPTSFVPVIGATSSDYSGTLGLRGQSETWRWDLSTVYGGNRVSLGLSPALNNRTLARPNSLDAGAQRFSQSTTNLELARDLPFFNEMHLAMGAELRRDGYQVMAGESASYSPGGNIAPYWFGLSSFTPAQATDRSRVMTGGHVDLEAELSPRLQLGVSGRLEHYADLGTQPAAKAMVRFEPVRRVVFRGSVARGFHAPTLQQGSITMVSFENPGSPFILNPVELVLPSDPRAVGFGASPLRAERSTDFQAGMAVELTPALAFTIDAYRTNITDRVVLGSVYYSATGTDFVHFFENAADTRTEGLDATATYGMRFDNGARLRLAAGANVNHSSITGTRSFVQATPLVSATPRDNLLGSATFGLGNLGAFLRTQRYGKVQGTNLFMEQTLGAHWATDANVSWTLLHKYTFTAGADNIFDVYPDRAAPTFPGTTVPPILPFNGYDGSSPFGFNGRFVFGRLSIYL